LHWVESCAFKDWVNDVAVDAKGKRRADGSTAKEAAAAAAAQHEAKLRESYVVVPAGDEAKSIQCPICKETLKSEFLEDDEDWVWMNAVRIQGRVSSRSF
jgi:pre-mRNA cleavage complex 2 protein Pcf11